MTNPQHLCHVLQFFALLGWGRTDLTLPIAIGFFSICSHCVCLLFAGKGVLNIDILMRSGSVWRHTDAYGCVAAA